MTSPLPERPNLEQLKKQAKTLLHQAHADQSAALQRFRQLPGFAGASAPKLVGTGLALHDAQSVIAREHGFASWRALREEVEARTLTFAAAGEEFVRCATGGAPGRAQRLLDLHPGIARANLHAELVLGDAEAVERRLKQKPDDAKRPGGPQEWEPLLYVCHTCLHRESPERAAGLVAVARLLLGLGANPNARYNWRWHAELPRTALWGALCAMDHLPLAEALLQAGADPTDGVSLHIAAGTGNVRALELLAQHRVNVNGIPGGLPPLTYILGFAADPKGPFWLLDHGADASLAWTESGEAPLHVAARRWDVAMAARLVTHGANVNARSREGRTPHTLAELHGNAAVAAWLLAHGARDELSELERFVAAAARGDRAGVSQMLAARPGLKRELRDEHHLMLQTPAERGDADVVETMLAGGFNPAKGDKDAVTPLHRAAMAGQPAAVQALIAGGAPVNALDGMFSANPLVWAAEGWSGTDKSERSSQPYFHVARRLIDAGSATEWTPPPGAPDPERGLENLAELCRGAARPE